MEKTKLVSEALYLELVLADPDGKWELRDGELRSKPPMTWEHDRMAWRVGYRLQEQLPFDLYEVRVDAGRARRSATNYYIPDVMVIPMEMARRLFDRPGMVEAYPEPLPLVVEVWSASTGDYDARDKLPEYRRRGDAEIWFIHPYQRTLIAWRKQPDDSYTELVHEGGTIRPVALPNVAIDLEEILHL